MFNILHVYSYYEGYSALKAALDDGIALLQSNDPDTAHQTALQICVNHKRPIRPHAVLCPCRKKYYKEEELPEMND